MVGEGSLKGRLTVIDGLPNLVVVGRDKRADDIDRFASLGIKAIRYPVLWERTAPDGIESADWTWSDERLPALRSAEEYVSIDEVTDIYLPLSRLFTDEQGRLNQRVAAVCDRVTIMRDGRTVVHCYGHGGAGVIERARPGQVRMHVRPERRVEGGIGGVAPQQAAEQASQAVARSA